MWKRVVLALLPILGACLVVSCGHEPAAVQSSSGPGAATTLQTSPGGTAAPTAHPLPSVFVKTNLPATLRPDSAAISPGGFVPGDPPPSTWFWSLGEFHGPNITIPPDKDVQVFLHLHAFTPGYKPQLTVTAGNGTVVFSQKLDGLALRKKRVLGPIKVPASVHHGKLDLTWKIDTWVPAEAGSNPKDSRHLGLDVESFEVR